MERLPVVSGLECVDTLRKMGFRVTTDGEHLVGLQRGRRIVIVPRVATLTPIQLHMVLAKAKVAARDFVWYLRAPAWRFFGMAVEAGSLDALDNGPISEHAA